MARPRKEGTNMTVLMRQDLYDRLCAYAEEKGQTKTMALERLLERSLNEEQKNK